jgi:hypothetical protein
MQLCGDRGQRAAAWCLTLLNKNKFLLPEKARDPKHQSVAVLRHAWRGAATPPPVKLADAPRHEPGASNLSTPDLREFILQGGQNREKVADEPVIGNLEDWRFFVFVDRDDDLRILHPGEMLYGA